MPPAESASVQRVSRRMPELLSALPLLTDSIAIAIGYSIAGLPNPVVASGIVVTCLALASTYRRRLTLSGLDAAPSVAMAAAIGAVLATLLVGENVWARDMVAPIVAASIAALTARFVAYSLVRILRRLRLLRSRVVVVGADGVGRDLAERMLTHREYGLEPVLMIDDPSVEISSPLPDMPMLPFDAELRTALKNQRVDAAVVAFPRLDEDRLELLFADLDRLGCDIFVVPRLWVGCPVSGGLDRIGAVPIMRIRNPMHRNPMRHAKSIAEQCIAAVVLLTVSPLLAAVAVAEKLNAPKAPVLFRQTRIGLQGREFELMKFRSMTPSSDLESQTAWTIVGDSRVDSLGRFLRASSLDELPQLWNVLRGDMALIGPRPERPHFVEEFSSSVPGYGDRHRVPVGLTGWAAVNGLSGDTSIAERARFDNFYITNWSLWFDIKIALRTVWVLLVRFRGYHAEENRLRVEGRPPLVPECPFLTPTAESVSAEEVDHTGCPPQIEETAGALVMVAAFDGLTTGAEPDPPADREDTIGAGTP